MRQAVRVLTPTPTLTLTPTHTVILPRHRDSSRSSESKSMSKSMSKELTLPRVPHTVRPVTHKPDDQKFLRAAIKAGLRMQRSGSPPRGRPKDRGGAHPPTLQTSLRQRQSYIQF